MLGDRFGVYLVLLVAAAMAAAIAWVVRTRRWEATGRPHHRVLVAGGIVGLVAVVGYLALDGPIVLSHPWSTTDGSPGA